jgi:predicted secreted protein
VIRLGEADDGQSVVVPPQETVELILPEPSGGGYLWSWRVPDGVSILTDGPMPAGRPPAPGAGGQRLLRLRIDRPGRYPVRGQLARPWESRVVREFVVELDASGSRG